MYTSKNCFGITDNSQNWKQSRCPSRAEMQNDASTVKSGMVSPQKN